MGGGCKEAASTAQASEAARVLPAAVRELSARVRFLGRSEMMAFPPPHLAKAELLPLSRHLFSSKVTMKQKSINHTFKWAWHSAHKKKKKKKKRGNAIM